MDEKTGMLLAASPFLVRLLHSVRGRNIDLNQIVSTLCCGSRTGEAGVAVPQYAEQRMFGLRIRAYSHLG